MLRSGIVLLAVMSVSVPAASQDRSAIGLTLESRYTAMKAAMARKDEAAIRSLLAAGFVSVDVTGKSQTASAVIKEVLALPSDPTRQSHTTILSVHGDDRAVVVEQRYDMTKTALKPDGSKSEIALSTLSTDKWVHDGGSWRLARSVTRELDMTSDGVTLAHRVNPKTN